MMIHDLRRATLAALRPPPKLATDERATPFMQQAARYALMVGESAPRGRVSGPR